MHSSFDAWKEEFAFSKELAALEQELPLGLDAAEREELALTSLLPEDITDLSDASESPVTHSAPAPEPAQESPTASERWDALVEAVSLRVLSRVEAAPQETPAAPNARRKPQDLEKGELEKNELKLVSELKQDNKILATQVRDLLAENDRLHMELECREMQLSRFRRIMGRLFLFTPR